MSKFNCRIYPPCEAIDMLLALNALGDEIDALLEVPIYLLPEGEGQFSLVVSSGSAVADSSVIVLRRLREMLDIDLNPPRELLDTDKCLPLDQAMFALLLISAKPSTQYAREDLSYYDPHPQELMLILEAPSKELERIEELILNHATLMKKQIIDRDDEESIGFFLLVNDPERGSIYGSLEASGFVDNIYICEAYHRNKKCLYCPRGLHPPKEGIDAFLALMARQTIANSLGDGNAWVVLQFLSDDNKGAEVDGYCLTDFHRRAMPGYRWTVKVQDLTGHCEPEFDADEMQQVYDENGYRLRLQPGFNSIDTHHDQDYTDDQLERIQDQIIALEAQFEFLMTADAVSPLLYRFDYHQLPALIGTLRLFPIDDLVEGRVRYCFAGSRLEEHGAHYVLFEPDSSMMLERFPHLYWNERLGPEPYVFNLDPFWAKHYAANSISQVFVPSGTALFPQLNSWRAPEMDDYLQKIMRSWFPTEEGLDFPERPFFLFDLAADPSLDISVQLLDQENFQAFPKRIGWLNDNIEYLDNLDGLEKQIVGVAKLLREKRLIETVDADVKETRTNLQKQWQEIKDKTWSAADKVLDELEARLESVTLAATESSNSFDVLFERLENENKYLENYKRRNEEIENAINSKSEDALSREEEFYQGIGSISTRLDSISEAFDKVEESTKNTVNDIADRLNDLYERMK